MPRTSAAQYPPEAPGNDVVPVPGASTREARRRHRVPCDQVISILNRSVRGEKGRGAKVESQKERVRALKTIARRLGTTELWVVQCMATYGRRIPARLESIFNEDAVALFEDAEPEEAAAEDVEEPGARERDIIAGEKLQNRRELPAADPNRRGKEPVARLRPESEEQTGEEDQ
jgi:hypothetical protein